jgi:hypothetical protein
MRHLMSIITIIGFVCFPVFAHSQLITSSESLLRTDSRVDYLIITPSQFASDLQAHAEWRSRTTATHPALRTRIVTIEDINREFGDSTKNLPQSQAEAIRTFIGYTLQFWSKPAPSRVMLVGSTNLLPAYRVKVGIDLFTRPPYIFHEDSIPMDEWYVVNKYRQEFTTRPQAAIGRIPGRTSAEIRRVLAKTRLFEESGNSLGFDLSTRATVILDAEDNEVFDSQVFLLDNFLRYSVKKPMNMNVVNYQTIATQPNARRQVTNAISDNKPIVMYYGHGAPEVWSKYSILTTDDVGNNLARNGKPFMMVTLGCSQNYDAPRKPSIVEAMMLLDNGGAALTVASSGYSTYPDNGFFIRLYFREIFTKSIDVGTAILNAKSEMYTVGMPPQDDIVRRIALLGDPALVPFSRLATSVNAPPPSALQGTMTIAPNPASAQTTLQYRLLSASDIRLDVVNLLGQTVMSVRETQGAGDQSLNIITDALPTGMYSCRLFAGEQQQNIMLTVSR